MLYQSVKLVEVGLMLSSGWISKNVLREGLKQSNMFGYLLWSIKLKYTGMLVHDHAAC